MTDASRREPGQRRSRETVDYLLEAAAELFARDGLDTTTNKIAERAGVSIDSLYQYFPNKQALLHALAVRHVQDASVQLRELLTELRLTELPFEETVRAIQTSLVDMHRDRPNLHALMHRMGADSQVELAALHSLEDHLAAELEFHLVRAGRGDPHPTATARTVVHAVDAQLHRVATRGDLRVDLLQVEPLTDLVLRLTGPVSGTAHTVGELA